MLWVDLKARRAISDLQEELAKVQRNFKELELDWASAYDKLRSMMQRVAKRAEVVESAARDASQQGVEAEAEATVSTSTPHASTLTARQIHLQREILRRRGNGGR